MDKALELYRAGADGGDLLACFNLAVSLDFLATDPAEVLEARQYYAKASTMDTSDHPIIGARCLELGVGCSPDPATAAEIYSTLAIEQRDPDAQFFLGRCYQLGLGRPKSDSLALSWLLEAAKQNHALAQRAVQDLEASLAKGQKGEQVPTTDMAEQSQEAAASPPRSASDEVIWRDAVFEAMRDDDPPESIEDE